MSRDRAILHLRTPGVSFEVYGQLFSVLADVSPVVQALPPDGALMDVTGALGYFGRTPAGLADLLQTRLLARYGLTVSVGGGPTRMIATMAAETCAPGRVLVLDPDPAAVEAFLRARPVRALPGVGPALVRGLVRYGIESVGDLADLPLATLQRIAGGTGRLLHQRAHGIDPRGVTVGGPPASIAAGRRFERDVLDPDEVRQALLALAADLGARLRTAGKTARAVELQVTYADRSTTTRSRTLREATAHTPVLQDTLYALFAALGLQRARIRAVTARVNNLAAAEHGFVQLTLDATTENNRALEPVLDKANRRWGTGTVHPAALTNPKSHATRPTRRSRHPDRS
ncbi:DinB/UmuC family translesion DNA polymerase [Kitasatospora indigofera]|uniref:DinB/UmuC family translesion DNA polymerase n=1 Tax=Kitasatospora indigofera TaxID=67307 RepID=UPI0033AABE92